MSRILQTVLIAAALVLPFSAKADTGLPPIIRDALHDAATTGNPLVVDAVADRMGNLFPIYRSEISLYVETVVDAAAQVMSGVNMMLADIPADPDQGFALLFDTHDMTEEAEAASLASDLNDLDVGAGEPVSAIQ